jgi:hypothetical protein
MLAVRNLHIPNIPILITRHLVVSLPLTSFGKSLLTSCGNSVSHMECETIVLGAPRGLEHNLIPFPAIILSRYSNSTDLSFLLHRGLPRTVISLPPLDINTVVFLLISPPNLRHALCEE